ncbi:MAG: ATP-binding cassette domain-containing protein [Clostridia bacterium]|nr:ATP-binding cassette domain-containing protein [Clostridia bacterium]
MLLGSSASGKTTLLDMLGGMDTITSGKIRSNEINTNVIRKELNICQL